MTTPVVTTTAAAQAGNMRAAKAPPVRRWWVNTSRFVRLAPGRSSDAALAMNTQP
jgi:hypothetical protein